MNQSPIRSGSQKNKTGGDSRLSIRCESCGLVQWETVRCRRCGRGREWVAEAFRVATVISKVLEERKRGAMRARLEHDRLPEILSLLFRAVRISRGLRQRDVAVLGGVGLRWVTTTERCERKWSARRLELASRCMGIPVRVFLEWGQIAVQGEVYEERYVVDSVDAGVCVGGTVSGGQFELFGVQ